MLSLARCDLKVSKILAMKLFLPFQAQLLHLLYSKYLLIIKKIIHLQTLISFIFIHWFSVYFLGFKVSCEKRKEELGPQIILKNLMRELKLRRTRNMNKKKN